MEVEASLSQGRTAAAQCGLFTKKNQSRSYLNHLVLQGTICNLDDQGIGFQLTDGATFLSSSPICSGVHLIYYSVGTSGVLPADKEA